VPILCPQADTTFTGTTFTGTFVTNKTVENSSGQIAESSN